MIRLLHLCDSLFPIGGFAYSDGLEWATSTGAIVAADGLRAWLNACLDETIGRVDGPAVWIAWRAVQEEDFDALSSLDEELTALRPSSTGRAANLAMGRRLLTTWGAVHPDPRIGQLVELAKRGRLGPTLPVAFAAAAARSGIGRRDAVDAYAYTRLAATISAAMRLMAIGQTDAHALLARALERVPGVVDAIAARDAAPESFAPAMDIASMSQQYLHSRLFRS